MMNSEYEKSEEQSRAEAESSGFSEKELDLDIEVRAGEWQNLKKFKTYQQRSRQGKIIATYQAVSNRLNQLVVMYYKLVSVHPHQGQKMLSEIKKLRLIQEILLQCLSWSEQSKGIDRNMVPQEVWDLIK